MNDSYYNNRRRIRANQHIRELATTIQLNHKEFIQPLFLDETISTQTVIDTLNEVNSDTIQSALVQIEKDLEKGISKFLLFPVPAKKSVSNFDYHFIINAIREIKKKFGNSVWIAADLCLCAYTNHGHCGILNANRDKVLNTESVIELSKYALQVVKAGADCIAPSDMMDGRIGAIRETLNENQFDDISIMSYSAKFSSQFYGPFRDACKSTPGNNCNIHDRRTYQASAFNKNDAILSTLRDIEEGADIVMVKPALPYLDVIHELSNTIKHPLAAYHVSGEYQSIELLAQNNIIERDKAHIEVWTALKRGGANIIISYAARHAKEWIEKIEY
ncbi:porphobilinogen synthase [Ferruginibacter sp. SUN106]|uniref:porphobilinogen synthase n=1 Tax=Ferruginibacter sp. SUN106 TaxID=2978348 RepID=UPI003D368BE9